MTRWILPMVAAAALVSGVALAAEAEPAASRLAVVVDAGSAAPRVIAAAEAGGADVRVPRTATEQLSVTHLLAAQRYDVIVGVGLDRRVAVDPVAERYPGTRFALVAPSGVARALR
jgi:hypothetical protein